VFGRKRYLSLPTNNLHNKNLIREGILVIDHTRAKYNIVTAGILDERSKLETDR
jgi:hypothetical protein